MSVDPDPLTLAEFLAWEERQTTKHEYRGGRLFAMAGNTDIHAQIVMNLSAMIRPALRGTACRVYASEMKVASPFPASRYPDVIVTCDKRDALDRLTKRHPKLVVEVLSTSTAAVDMGDKLDEYQTIGELEEYVLIDSRKPGVRIYRRAGEKLETEPAAVTGSILLQSLDLTLTFAEIYEDVAEIYEDVAFGPIDASSVLPPGA